MNRFQILIEPHLSEKCITNKEANNKVTFKVHPDANKFQIKDAVEKIFNVSVLKVCTVNVTGKLKKRGRFQGFRADWKKAIIKLKTGDTISYFEGA